MPQLKRRRLRPREELSNPEPETPVIVSYSPEVLKLNGVVMGSDMDFITRLDQMMPARRNKTIILTASPVLPHGKVVRLMDILKRHGAETLDLLKWDSNASGNQAGAQS